jgi:hypothetical protein
MRRVPLAKTADRGYGTQHRAERAKWAPIVEAGQGWCAEIICIKRSRRIAPGEPWHLAHTEDRTAYRGPSHEACNVAEVNRRRARKMVRWVTSRTW